MDQIESAALRDDMEQLHMVSREVLLQAARTATRVAEAVLHVRAERARQAAEADRRAWEGHREHTRAYRDAQAAVWETRLRDPHWFADAPVQEVMDTWASADAWARTGDARAAAAREQLRLRVRGVGLDPDLVQTAVDARDAQTLSDLLDAPAGPPDGPTDGKDTGRDPSRDDDGRGAQDSAGPATRPRAAGAGMRTGGRATVRSAARGPAGTSPDEVREMAELVRETLHPDAAAKVLADTHWPRVAGQLFRAREKIDQFNQANPQRAINLRELMMSLQDSRPDGKLRSPAGWLIWQLHNASASQGVKLIAQTRPRGSAASTGHARPASGRSRTADRPRQARRPDPERD